MFHFVRAIGIIKELIIRIFIYGYLHSFGRKFLKENIWLICEKRTEARDNGYWLYRWIRECKPDINIYYAISDDSVDRKKIIKYGNIITFGSFKHLLFAMSARYSISSQPFGADPSASDERVRKLTRCLNRRNQQVIHLKHGVHINNTGHYLDWPQSGIDMLCCVSEREQDFLHKTFNYPYERIPLTGMCRYDHLYSKHEIEKTILIMPTSRNWLSKDLHKETQDEKHIALFKESLFFKEYEQLLSSKGLLCLLKETGYKVIFYPHYALQNMLEAFKDVENEYITLASRKKYDVQQLLMTSSVLVTDYSSIFFDFGYMKKPLVYFQFDYEEFRAKRYAEGYFSYQEDGFGPVVKSSSDVVSFLIDTIINREAKMNSEYEKKVDTFFFYRDDQNCRRVFDSIVEIGNTN